MILVFLRILEWVYAVVLIVVYFGEEIRILAVNQIIVFIVVCLNKYKFLRILSRARSSFVEVFCLSYGIQHS